MHNKPLSGKNTFAQASNESTATDQVFPSVRYFQIHFEFLQEQLHQTCEALQALQIRINQLEQQFGNQPGSSPLQTLPATHKHPATANPRNRPSGRQ